MPFGIVFGIRLWTLWLCLGRNWCLSDLLCLGSNTRLWVDSLHRFWVVLLLGIIFVKRRLSRCCLLQTWRSRIWCFRRESVLLLIFLVRISLLHPLIDPKVLRVLRSLCWFWVLCSWGGLFFWCLCWWRTIGIGVTGSIVSSSVLRLSDDKDQWWERFSVQGSCFWSEWIRVHLSPDYRLLLLFHGLWSSCRSSGGQFRN